MDKATEKRLQNLETTIEGIYAEAHRDLQKKLDDFTEKVKKQDAQKRKQVEEGKLSEEKYREWQKHQVFTGQLWEAKVKEAAENMTRANEQAAAVTRSGQMDVYAAGLNHGTYELEHNMGLDTAFTIVDKEAVERMLEADPQLLPEWKIDEPKDYVWNYNKVKSITTQALLQGKSVREIGDDLVDGLQTQNKNKMRMFARTAMTGAHNAGTMDAMHRAEGLGIKVRKKWLATRDARTRDVHSELNGQIRDIDDDFQNALGKIKYPGDPTADAGNVFNCRCTMTYVYPELDEIPDEAIDSGAVREMPQAKQMSFDDWMEAHEQQKKREEKKPEPKPEKKHTVVQGEDITGTFEWRQDEFATVIEDVINAQGFDGNPRVVSPEEFDKAVAESNFVAQRTYSAPDQETLDAYREQLYNGGPGNWYVDCGTGGAQYGQGMYCAADYTGTITDGMQAEMIHYQTLGKERTMIDAWHSEIGSMTADDFNSSFYVKEPVTEDEARVFTTLKADPSLTVKDLSTEDRAIVKGISDTTWQQMGLELDNRYDEFRDSFKGHSYTETLTLTPDAKIITYDELEKEFSYGAIQTRMVEEIGPTLSPPQYSALMDWAESDGDIKIDDPETRAIAQDIEERAEILMGQDIGAYAAMRGYDAINAEGHGQSGSYTVILNRTKCIFRGGSK